jgi:hypothetical protein
VWQERVRVRAGEVRHEKVKWEGSSPASPRARDKAAACGAAVDRRRSVESAMAHGGRETDGDQQNGWRWWDR